MYDVSCNLKRTLVICLYLPSHHRDEIILDFNRRHAGRVDATTCIEIREIPIAWIFQTMGMPTNKHGAIFLNPIGIILLNLMAFIGILNGTGRILKTQGMKMAPEIFQRQHTEIPALVIGEVPLMSMNHKDILSACLMFEHQAFNRFNVR